MKSTKILCLGDSLTEAYGVAPENGWVHLLGEALGVSIVNAGISGDNTTGILGRCEPLLKEHKPTHIVIMGGTNDILFGLKDEFIISNIHAMSRYAKYYDVECIIGIPTAIINEEELNFINENVTDRISNYQKTLISYCKNDGKTFVDFTKNILPEHYLEDGVHINESGHLQMMHTAYSTFSKLIN